MMTRHSVQQAVLVLTVDDDPVVGVVLRAHLLYNRLGLVMSVTTHSAPVRGSLDANANANADTDGTRLVVYARTDTAIATAGVLTAAAPPAVARP